MRAIARWCVWWAAGLAPATLAAQAPADTGTTRPATVRSGFFVGADLVPQARVRSGDQTGGRWRGGPGAVGRIGFSDVPGYGFVLEGLVNDVAIGGVTHELIVTDFFFRQPIGHRVTRAGLLEGFVDVGGGILTLTRDPDAAAAGPRIVMTEGPALSYGAGARLHWRRCLAVHVAAHAATGWFTDRRTGMTTTHGVRDGAQVVRVGVGVDWLARSACAPRAP